MNTVTWIVQCLLAIVMLGAGAMKLTQSREQLMASGKMDWIEDFADSQIKGIGALELLRWCWSTSSSARSPSSSQ